MSQPRHLMQDAIPYAVPDRLDDLQGPTSGTVRLPLHLHWQPNPVYDLDTDNGRGSLYETVLREGDQTDLIRYLNADLLRQLWPTLIVPLRCRPLWEDRFPELASC